MNSGITGTVVCTTFSALGSDGMGHCKVVHTKVSVLESDIVVSGRVLNTAFGVLLYWMSNW